MPLLVGMLATLASAVAATAIMLRSIDNRDWGAIGLARGAAGWQRVLSGLAAGGIPITLVCGLLLAIGYLRFEPSPAESSWIGAALRISLVLVPYALAEEMIFRGYLFTVAREAVGDGFAIVGTSVVFGMLHIANGGWTPLSITVVMLSGLMLGSVRVAYDSLYAAWAAHVAWNWVMAVPLHAPVSGIQFEAPGYRAVTAGPDWLSGGSWGPEGGVIAALGMMGGIGYFYMRRRRRES